MLIWNAGVAQYFELLAKKSIEDISIKLNAQPTSFFVKGELYSKRNPKSKVREENLWIFDSKLGEQDPLESHIKYLLSFIKEKEAGITELQLDCEFDISCSYFSSNGQGGFTLDKETLKELTMYPIDLSINLYPPEISG